MKVGMIGGKFLPLHLGHVYAITKAAGYVDKLYVVLSSSIPRDRMLCREAGIKYMDSVTRMNWLGQVFADIDNIHLIHVEDEYYEEDYNWEEGAEQIKDKIPETITHVFSSEESYDEIYKKNYPGAEHIIIDNNRELVPVSATKIRNNIQEYWEYLPYPVKKFFTLKICVVGTESCGKSTLVKKLAKVYNTNYVHEVGIDYCLKHKNELTPEIFDSIAMKHFLTQEEKMENSNKILFVDSDAVITQYYAEMYLGYTSKVVETIINRQHFDLMLYLEPDVKWIDDGLRFAGEDSVRKKNNKALKEAYRYYGKDIKIISGDYNNRFEEALFYISEL